MGVSSGCGGTKGTSRMSLSCGGVSTGTNLCSRASGESIGSADVLAGVGLCAAVYSGATGMIICGCRTSRGVFKDCFSVEDRGGNAARRIALYVASSSSVVYDNGSFSRGSLIRRQGC